MDVGLRNSLAGVAGVLLGLGLLLGLIQTTIPGPGGSALSCGSPWMVNTSDIRKADNSGSSVTARGTRVPGTVGWGERCDDAFGSRTGWSIALAGLGALGLLGVALVMLQASASPSGREPDRTRRD